MGCFCLDKVQLLFDSLVGLQLYGTEFIEGFQGFWMDCLNRMVLEIFWRVFSHPDAILNNLTAATFFHHYPGQMILFRKASLLRHLAVSSGSNSDAFFAGAFDSNVAYAFKKGVTYSTFALVRILHIPLHKNDSVAELHSRCQGASAELRDVNWRICSEKSSSKFLVGFFREWGNWFRACVAALSLGPIGPKVFLLLWTGNLPILFGTPSPFKAFLSIFPGLENQCRA